MADPYGTEPMFDIPDRYKPPKRQQAAVAWRQHKGKQTSCDDCILALARGEVKFSPNLASHVRTTPVQRGYYCTEHAMSRKADDVKRRLWKG